MKTSTLLVFVLLFVGAYAQTETKIEKEEASGIEFEHSAWQEILQKAKKENKLIFIDAYTTWCGPCKMMAKNVFTDVEVGAFYNANFVNVKLDMEKEPGLSLKSKLNVSAYPTLIFVDANEKIEHKAVGALPKADFLKFGNEALNGTMNLSDFNEMYQKQGLVDYKFVVDYLNMLESAGENAKLKEVVVEYLDALNEAQLLSQENWDLLKKYIHNTDNKAFQYLLNQREKFENAFGEKEVGEKIYYTFLRQANNLCDKLESGKYQLNSDRQSRFSSELKKYNIEDRDKILAYSEISTARTLEDWNTYANAISKYLKANLIDKSVMSLYNYALPVNRATDDRGIRKEAAKWCDMGLQTENLDGGFKNAFVKLKADLIK